MALIEKVALDWIGKGFSINLLITNEMDQFPTECSVIIMGISPQLFIPLIPHT